MASVAGSRFFIALVLIYFLCRFKNKDHTKPNTGCSEELGQRLRLVSISLNMPRKKFPISTIARASALIGLLLMMAGDVESNPGPTCASCSGQFGTVSRTRCGHCREFAHDYCAFRVPDMTESFCKSCFWIKVSTMVPHNSMKTFEQKFELLTNDLNRKFEKLTNDFKKYDKNTTQNRSCGSAVFNLTTPKTSKAPRTPRRPLQLEAPKTQSSSNNRSTSLRPPQNGNYRKTASNPKTRDANVFKLGTNKMTHLKAAHEVPQRPRVKVLFVSRIDLNHEIHDMKTYVQKILGVENKIKVTKLSGMNENFYNSFHIEVEENCFRDLLDPSVWPEGILFKPFRGPLKPFRIFGAAATNSEIGTKRPRGEEIQPGTSMNCQ